MCLSEGTRAVAILTFFLGCGRGQDRHDATPVVADAGSVSPLRLEALLAPGAVIMEADTSSVRREALRLAEVADHPLRSDAISKLATFHDAATLAALARLLDDSQVSKKAAEAVAARFTLSSTEELFATLRGESAGLDELRALAYRTLARRGGKAEGSPHIYCASVVTIAKD